MTVFVFHEITDAPSAFHREQETYTSPDVFRRQLAWITARFEVVEPTRMCQFGGDGQLPENAALLTFDDSWAGIFRDGVSVLGELGLPAMCFVNMGTVAGDPDLAAVRAYELAGPDVIGFAGFSSIDRELGAEVISQVRRRYGDNQEFWAYQGPTATAVDLQRAADAGHVWLGSHLYHHWDLRRAADDLYETSLARNAEELRRYPNALPAFATPHGYAGEDGRDIVSVAARQGLHVVFTARGTQNNDPNRAVLDRLFLPPEPATRRGWWHATHLDRALETHVS